MLRSVIYILMLSTLSQSLMAAAAHISSVEIRNGFVILNASVNGQNGYYLLDSGAPGLVVNSERHRTEAAQDNWLHGVNGAIEISQLGEWTFRWNAYSVSGKDALAVNLSYLESTLDLIVDGIVGLDVFNGYYVLIDYAHSAMELWRDMPPSSARTAWVEFPVEMEGHVPVVTLTRDHQQFKFGIDTGAETNLIDGTICNAWDSGVTQVDVLNLVGINQQKVKSAEVAVEGFTSRTLSFPETHFVMTDLTSVAEVTGVALDGILGQPFLAGRIILIDRDRQFLRVSNVIQPQERITDSPIILIAGR